MCEQNSLSTSMVKEDTLHTHMGEGDKKAGFFPATLYRYTAVEKAAIKQSVQNALVEKGYTYADIAQVLEVTPKYAKEIVREEKFGGEKGQQLLMLLDISLESLLETTISVASPVTEKPVVKEPDPLPMEVGDVSSVLQFLLTSADFPTLRGKVEQKDVEDTKKLILEVARRVKLFCTLEDEEVRKKIYFALEDAINVLFVNLHSAGTAYPWKAAKELESRAEFAKKIL